MNADDNLFEEKTIKFVDEQVEKFIRF
jgi:hypothetical protein